MSHLQQRLAVNLANVRAEMQAACYSAGRSIDDVTLVAVTKYAELDWVRELAALGVTDLGENRPQQLIERHAQLTAANWHLIGHLQRNKVRAALPCSVLIHSVDSFKLLDRIGQIAEELGLTPHVLLEVNVSSEASKDGFDADLLLAEWPLHPLPANVVVEGLMTMAPLNEDPEQARPLFRALRELRDALQSRRPRGSVAVAFNGMSGDFAVAIEEGATHIRVGSRLFDGL